MDEVEGNRARFTYHGGDLAGARLAYPDAPAPWLDLSTGINPIPYPVPDVPPEAWTALPAPADLARLESAAARAYGTEPARVVAAPGTQALIGWLPRLVPARHVVVLGFTYAEHARVWREAGATVETAADLHGLAGADVAVVVNPNNPDGRLVAPVDLASLARTVGLLVVDEAFVDVMPDGSSLVPALPANAVVLRSFGKMYGLAGLRLGFAVARDLAPALRRAVGPWAVSGPALAIGTAALADAGWLGPTRTRLEHDAARLDALLEGQGARILGGTPLFRLAEVGETWFEALARQGILTRPFATDPGRLRFGLPATRPQWDRLARAILAIATVRARGG